VIAELAFEPGLILNRPVGETGRVFPISLSTLGPAADKRAIYSLRYRSFRAAGWIGPCTTKAFEDRYDGLDTSLSIAAHHGGACVGTIRLTFGGDGHGSETMPAQANFPAELGRLGAAGHRRLVEFTRLAVEPDLANTSFRTTLYGTLVRAATVVALAGRVDYAVVAVHEKLSKVYRALCGFEVLARAAGYGDIAEPTHLLGREFAALNARRSLRNAFFRITPHDVAVARQALVSVAPRLARANGVEAAIRRDNSAS
jgi:N-acyl-L-homoserine lactone synthetase